LAGVAYEVNTSALFQAVQSEKNDIRPAFPATLIHSAF